MPFYRSSRIGRGINGEKSTTQPTFTRPRQIEMALSVPREKVTDTFLRVRVEMVQGIIVPVEDG
jgi:hypothetical protein